MADIHPSGFFVIVPLSERDRVPLGCPVCKILMRDADDARAFREFGCCSWCSSRWAEPLRSEWEEGWRPNESEISIEVNRRQANLIRLPIW